VGKKGGKAGGCRLEAVVGVDDRGQMVLPKDLREKMGIRPGDRLALVGWERKGRTVCATMVKAEDLSGPVREVLGPMVEALL
jgi:antitoxin PrlF